MSKPQSTFVRRQLEGQSPIGRESVRVHNPRLYAPEKITALEQMPRDFREALEEVRIQVQMAGVPLGRVFKTYLPEDEGSEISRVQSYDLIYPDVVRIVGTALKQSRFQVGICEETLVLDDHESSREAEFDESLFAQALRITGAIPVSSDTSGLAKACSAALGATLVHYAAHSGRLNGWVLLESMSKIEQANRGFADFFYKFLKREENVICQMSFTPLSR